MGQMIVVDEDEYNKLKLWAERGKKLYQKVENIQEFIYPDWNFDNSSNNYSAYISMLDRICLDGIYNGYRWKKRLLFDFFSKKEIL